MKTLKNLKLTQLSNEELKRKEMSSLKGGLTECCGCGNSVENLNANSGAGYSQHIGGNTQCVNWSWNDGGGWSQSGNNVC